MMMIKYDNISMLMIIDHSSGNPRRRYLDISITFGWFLLSHPVGRLCKSKKVTNGLLFRITLLALLQKLIFMYFFFYEKEKVSESFSIIKMEHELNKIATSRLLFRQHNLSV